MSQNLIFKPIFTNFFIVRIHEQGLYDYAASIDYITTNTNATKLDFLGFSMGITHIYILLCERPEYNQKVGDFQSFF